MADETEPNATEKKEKKEKKAASPASRERRKRIRETVADLADEVADLSKRVREPTSKKGEAIKRGWFGVERVIGLVLLACAAVYAARAFALRRKAGAK